ncbi:MAG: hypothetical protein HKO99_04220 [Xanthomonadales bacterium]|nr:hypothetical protein [Gammaproteobacteria bacterium]MBT8053013.1 hypothetical protein [Gammaproteobacteria bacterium]NNK50785.1 hypothetical protein [Xanthomonadales bacterium]
MKTRFSTAVAALAMISLLSAGTVFALDQQRDRNWHKGPPSVEQKLARISEALNLSDEQSSQMLAILQEQEQRKAALHEQTMALLGPEICAHRAESEEAILSILDDEQAALFQESQEKRRERAGQRDRRRARSGDLDCADFAGDDS